MNRRYRKTIIAGNWKMNKTASETKKFAEELKPWGEVDGNAREALAQQGVVLRYYVAQTSTYDAHAAEWGADLTIVEIGRDASSVYFVVVTSSFTM